MQKLQENPCIAEHMLTSTLYAAVHSSCLWLQHERLWDVSSALGNNVVTSFALNTLDDARIHICHLENVVSAELP